MGPFNLFLATSALVAMLVYKVLEGISTQFFDKSTLDLANEYVFMSVFFIFMAMFWSLADYNKRSCYWKIKPGAFAGSFFDGFLVTSIALLFCLVFGFSQKMLLLLVTFVGTIILFVLLAIVFHVIEGRGVPKASDYLQERFYLFSVFVAVSFLVIGFCMFIYVDLPVFSSALVSFGIRLMVDCLFEPPQDSSNKSSKALGCGEG